MRRPRPRGGARRHGRRPDARHRRRDLGVAAVDRSDRADAGDEDGRSVTVQRRGRRQARRRWRFGFRRAFAYGAAVGAAFQIADDLLDAEGDTATLGKRAGKDADRHKATLVAALELEGARRELAALVAKAKAAVDAAALGEGGDVLRATAEFVAARKS